MIPKLSIRFAKKNDLEAIVAIYNQAIRSKRTTGDTNEFVVRDRLQWFQKYDDNNYPCYVVELEGSVVAYCTLSPYRPGRKAMSKVAEISYYVDYNFHGKGIGTKLLKHAIADCNRIKKESLLAILLDINPKSVQILEKFHFKKWGYFPDIINLDGKKCGQLVYGLKLNP